MKDKVSELCKRDLETRRAGGYDGYREAIIKALSEPRTRVEITKLAGASEATTRRWLQILMAKNAIHICDWEHGPRQGPWSPIYKLGFGINAPCPDQRQRDKVHKPKPVAAPIRTHSFRDPLVEALFGTARKAA